MADTPKNAKHPRLFLPDACCLPFDAGEEEGEADNGDDKGEDEGECWSFFTGE